MIRSLLPIFVGTSVLIAGGSIQNHWASRSQAALRQAASRLLELPPTIGTWTSEELPLRPQELEMAEAEVAVSRRYVHRQTGHALQVMILCGRPGPIAVHPPTACFTGAGYRLAAAPRVATVPIGKGGAQTFWQADFLGNDQGIQTNLHTWWGWTTEGNCIAAKSPRWEFAGKDFLYKVYLIQGRNELEPDEDEAAIQRQFLDIFLPALRKTLAEESNKS